MLMLEECRLRLVLNSLSVRPGGSGDRDGWVIALVLTRMMSTLVVRDRLAVASAPVMRRGLNVSNLRISSGGAAAQIRVSY
jgi:hypothetical protein